MTATKIKDTNPRREFLTRIAVASLGTAALGMAASVQAATEPHQPAAETGHDYTMFLPHSTTARQFYAGVIPIAVLSGAASGLTVDKASAAAREFANFELREAIGVLTVLKQMRTPTPPMDAHAKAMLAKLKASGGVEFDKAYITAELGAHDFVGQMLGVRRATVTEVAGVLHKAGLITYSRGKSRCWIWIGRGWKRRCVSATGSSGRISTGCWAEAGVCGG